MSICHRSHGSTGNRQDPGRVFKGKKMAGHLGAERVTTPEPEDRVAPMPSRGLILVRGAVPGAKGSWVLIQRRGEACAAGRRCRSCGVCGARRRRRTPRRPKRRSLRPRSGEGEDRVMKCEVTTLDAKTTEAIELADAVFGVAVRTDILARMVNWQLAKRRAGTHKTKT